MNGDHLITSNRLILEKGYRMIGFNNGIPGREYDIRCWYNGIEQRKGIILPLNKVNITVKFEYGNLE